MSLQVHQPRRAQITRQPQRLDLVGVERLVRWTLAGRERNLEAHRYFLHASNGQVMELDRDDALWWQFRLDADAKCPVALRFCSDANEVRFNGHLPRAIAQWLRFISQQPLRRKKYWYIYPLALGQFEVVSQVLGNNLGTRLITGLPSSV